MVTLVIEALTLFFYLFATYLLAVKYQASIEMVWCTEYVYFIIMGIVSFLYLKRKILGEKRRSLFISRISNTQFGSVHGQIGHIR